LVPIVATPTFCRLNIRRSTNNSKWFIVADIYGCQMEMIGIGMCGTVRTFPITNPCEPTLYGFNFFYTSRFEADGS
jgi:hypothetical protein